MKKVSSGMILTLLSAVSIWLICSPVSTDNDEDKEYSILMLSLEEPGRRTAEFSGAPIEAIIELDQDTLFSFVHWHTGEGDPVFSDTLLSSKAQKFSILLTWERYPLLKDSVDGYYYDTVFVSMGGGLKKSNMVFVKVTNLPVVADSVTFNAKSFSGDDSIWKYTFEDTAEIAGDYPLEFYAHDLDGDQYSVQVLARKGKVLQTSPAAAAMRYEPPEGDFADTVTFIAYDQKGSQVIRRLAVRYTSPNFLPVIDSVQVNSTLLKGSGRYTAGFVSVTSVKFRLYAHDTLGTIDNVIWKSKNAAIEPDSSNKFAAVWSCQSEACTDSTVDTSFIIDSVSVRVVDNRGDTVQKTIVLAKGTLNKPPEIKKLTFGDKSISFTDTMKSIGTTGGMSYPILLNTIDPEGGGITVAWKTTSGARLTQVDDSSALYRSPVVHDTDTLVITISDSIESIKRYIRITVDDIGPVVDSISINDTVIREPDSVIYNEVKAGDTLLLITYVRDRDPDDILQYSWSAGYSERFSIRQSNRAKYLLPDNNLNDTIICNIQDGDVTAVKKIIILPANIDPVVDSIQGNGTSLKKLSTNEYGDRRQISDTVTYEAFATDPDGGALSYLWSAGDSTRLLESTGTSVQYAADTMFYKDTITVIVSDSLSATVLRRIILQIDTVKSQ